MEKNKTKIVTIASLLALVMLIIGATYAYFAAQTGEGSQTDIRINANTVDTLTFETGDPITLTLDQENFAEGTGNQTGSTFAKAMLTANNKTNSATEHYYMYLNITENTFTYTQDEDAPEILLTITDTNNKEITIINGLTYKTVTDGSGTTLKGFDITNQKGLITIFENREITTTSSITEEWNVTVTYINYNFNQSANAGKSFSAKLVIQKSKLTLLKDYVIAQYTGTQGENNIYYHDSTLANGAGDNSYRYAGGDYILTELGSSIGVTSIISSDDTDTNTLIEFYCNGTKQYFGSYCSSSDSKYYLIKNDTTEYQAYGETLKSAEIKGYLKNDNVKNFVCFGSTENPCPTDNLYRIIGVIDNKVKLIKYDYATSALLGTDGCYLSTGKLRMVSTYKGTYGDGEKFGTYYWLYDSAYDKENTWSISSLNKVNLNTNYLNNLGSDWSNKIVTTTWKVGGNTYSKIKEAAPSVAYQNEIITPDATDSIDKATEYDTKIGLMYASDYGYAAGPIAWSLTLENYKNATVISNNWMYMGLVEWTISRVTNSHYAYNVAENGMVNNYNDTANNYVVRPSFSIKSSVTYVSGSGTQSDPIIIN